MPWSGCTWASILFVLFGGCCRCAGHAWPGCTCRAVAWGCAVEFLGLPCPLTPLENRLRRAAGDAGYSGGFVEHYLLPLIYPAGLTPAVQWILGAIVLLLNLIAYLYLLHRRGSR